MENQIELQQEILKVQSQIREIQQNLKNSKSYLKYLKECFEDEKKEVETSEEDENFVVGCATCGNDVLETDIKGNCNKCK